MAVICVDHDAFQFTTMLHSIVKCINDKKTVNFTTNPTGNHLTSIQIQNGTNIVKAFADTNIGEVANPDRIKSLSKLVCYWKCLTI